MKKTIRIIVGLGIAVGILVGILAVVLSVTAAGERTPASSNQVWNVLEQHGFAPQETTEEWRKSGDIQRVIGVHDDANAFQLEFFTFDTDDQAHYVVQQIHSHVRENLYVPNGESIIMQHQVGNFTFWSRVAHDRYMVITRIENTVFFIHCHDEERPTINALLKELGYLT